MNNKRNQALRVLVLLADYQVPREPFAEASEKTRRELQTEYDVIEGLKSLGHEVQTIGLTDNLDLLTKANTEFKPHIAFNLLEEFNGKVYYMPHVVSYLECIRLPYTGCNPRGHTIADDKALSKKILSYHSISVPSFAVFPRGGKTFRPKDLTFPLIVKSMTDHGSVGISQASVVYDEDKLLERVKFVQESTDGDAIAEEYIEGREIYVGVIGNYRLQTLEPWELIIENLPEGAVHIASGHVKWNQAYQKRAGVRTEAAKDISDEQRSTLDRVSKEIYRTLCMSGYARLDYRVKADGQCYLLEANPNPNIAKEEDFALAAKVIGLDYPDLLQKIVNLGMGSLQGWSSEDE
ncbi:MAG: D-alanine--D-alanine ligase [Proteobacteria bacterium]|nr:MAG: D-alanine--D-alanine ligase [Pseudomonadota bacterium]